jgi:hypothetical protein
MKKDNEFDDIFKKGLGDAGGPAYREDDWNAFAQMLDTPKKKSGLIFWIPVLSGAAILLIAFGWWVLRSENAQNGATKIQALTKVKQQTLAVDTVKPVLAEKNNVGTADKNDTGAGGKNAKEIYAQKAKPKDVGSGDKNGPNVVEKLAKNRRKDTIHWRSNSTTAAPNVLAANDKKPSRRSHQSDKRKHGVNSIRSTVEPDEGTDNVYAVNSVVNQNRDTANLVAYNSGSITGSYSNILSVNPLTIQAVALSTKPALLPVKRIKPVIKSAGFRPQYAISVIGAPEVNGVNSLSQTSSGTNLGVLFSVELFNKLYITTGGMYSVKPYSSNVAGYGYNSSLTAHNITSIDANCHVLDIPLNFDYQFYNKGLNKLSVGTGLSSYIMLYEHYQYNYGDPDVNGSVNKTIPQTNKYIFGVLNLQATYTRLVTSNVGISVQPYMKLPLTGIGATGARLQTAGFAIGLNWNFGR